MAKKTATKTTVRKAAKKKAPKKAPKKAAKNAAKKKAVKKWSKKVNETSDAMDLKADIFKLKDPKKIAQSLKSSASKSDRKKSNSFQSAMSMLNFYINRGGTNISAAQNKILEKAKDELRALFGRDPE